MILKRLKNLSFKKLPQKILSFLKIFPRFFIVENPFSLLKFYIQESSPPHIDLKSGLRIIFSSHPHDLITFVVVFLKKDYGRIKNDSTVIDVGANIGIFSLFAAKNGASKVYAFEPSQEAFEILCQNIKMNQLTDVIIPINKAVSDKHNISIKFPISSSPYNKIITDNSIKEQHFNKINTVNIGSFIIENNLKNIDLLKLDCEGAEFQILQSLNKSVLLRINEIRMECHKNPKDLLRKLRHNNFKEVRKESDNIWLKNSAIN